MSAVPKLNSDQTKPARLLARVLRGEIDPANDDFFILALEETKRAAELKEQRIARLMAQMEKIQSEIKTEQRAQASLQTTYREQIEAIERYQKTGEIADCIVPKCEDATRKVDTDVRRDEREAVKLEAPEGWDRSSVRVDDEFVYVTFRMRRSNAGRLPMEVRSRVIDAVALFTSLQAKQRRERLQLWNRLGRYTTMPIAANGP